MLERSKKCHLCTSGFRSHDFASSHAVSELLILDTNKKNMGRDILDFSAEKKVPAIACRARIVGAKGTHIIIGDDVLKGRKF